MPSGHSPSSNGGGEEGGRGGREEGGRSGREEVEVGGDRGNEESDIDEFGAPQFTVPTQTSQSRPNQDIFGAIPFVQSTDAFGAVPFVTS